jgi:putrescine transport system ATP-binding protein
MTLATRIGVMNSGEILQCGTPTEIYEYPTSKYVADFIGSVNMFQGRIVEDLPDRVRIASDEISGTIFVDHGVAAPPESTVYVAIRPEKILLSRDKPTEPENVFSGTVMEIAYMGDVSRYLIRLDGGKVVRVTQPNMFRHDDRLVWDERVWVYWHPSANVVVTT